MNLGASLGRRLVIGPGVVDWVAKQTNEYGNFGTEVGIGIQEDGRLIGGVAYAEFNGVNIVCHVASDMTRRWMTKWYLWAIFDYPFNQANVNRITVCVGEGNAESRRFVTKLGFVLEATLKGAHPTGDLLVYRMFKSECRFLTMRGTWHEFLQAA